MNKYFKQKIIIFIEIGSYQLLHNDRVHMGSKTIEWGFYFPLECFVSLSDLIETWMIQFRSYILNFKVVWYFDYFLKNWSNFLHFFGFSKHLIWKRVIIDKFQFQILFGNTQDLKTVKELQLFFHFFNLLTSQPTKNEFFNVLVLQKLTCVKKYT